MQIGLKRVYDPPGPGDGYRVLVERLWPRGVSRERAKVDRWIRDAGASPGLRVWFSHDPQKWAEFRRKYADEIRSRPGTVRDLKAIVREHRLVTFLFAARDREHNNAVALRDFLINELSEPVAKGETAAG